MSPKVALRLIRPRQWTKNLLVFAPLIFARRFHDLAAWGDAGAAFAAFSLVASAIYCVNDVLDVKHDRQHPSKRKRPVASGEITPAAALLLALVLAAAGLTLGAALGPWALAIVGGYFITMLLYGKWLKHVLLVDVFLIAAGLTVRAILGAVVIDVPVANWLLVCTFFVALMLALAKRRQELLRVDLDGGSQRRSLLGAPALEVWDSWITMMSGITILAYTLYTIDPQTIAKLGTDKLLYTTPVVTFAILRYQIIIHRDGEGEDPTEALLRDPWIVGSVVVWFGMVLTLLEVTT